LRALPQWFGIEESTQEYIEGVADPARPFFAVYDNDQVAGFASLTLHNEHTAEIYVMGVAPSHHRQGIGRTLIAACENFCRETARTLLTVKTLAPTHPDPHYAFTRKFYEGMGFLPVEIFPTLWGEGCPCLLMVKGV
jgi:GNAT superfamily N-acetyltransferase